MESKLLGGEAAVGAARHKEAELELRVAELEASRRQQAERAAQLALQLEGQANAEGERFSSLQVRPPALPGSESKVSGKAEGTRVCGKRRTPRCGKRWDRQTQVESQTDNWQPARQAGVWPVPLEHQCDAGLHVWSVPRRRVAMAHVQEEVHQKAYKLELLWNCAGGGPNEDPQAGDAVGAL
jgi:hypothetical protein